MHAYTVTVTREDNQWVAVTSGLPVGTVGAMDFDSFEDVHTDMPEVLADLTDSDPEDFTIIWRYEVNGRDMTRLLEQMRQATEALRKVQQDQELARKEALAALHDAGLSQRAMADVVGLSHQRVNQLLNC